MVIQDGLETVVDFLLIVNLRVNEEKATWREPSRERVMAAPHSL